MTTPAFIAICILLLIAYLFDVSSPKTRIPTIILLLLLGWVMRRVVDVFSLDMPPLESALPILGTVGLILIVLDGSLELQLKASRLQMIKHSTIVAFVPMLVFSIVLAFIFHKFLGISFKVGLINAIPISVISSAVAISSTRHLAVEQKEFVTYESSMSDIFGVILFNFVVLNEHIDGLAVAEFLGQIVIMLIISFVASVGLAFLLGRIKHSVKFVPIIISILLIYSLSKVYHLPGLLFIMIFGIFAGNMDELSKYSMIERLQPKILDREVKRFEALIKEFVFMIRSLFFILFGYLIETAEILNQETILWSCAIVAAIYILRGIFLWLNAQKLFPLIFVAPRGLINILLFLSIPASQVIPLVNKSLIIQVIIITAILMMLGLMFYKQEEESTA